jgi:hypothetical protein
MSDYLLKHTDGVTSFIVRPYTANGPATPTSSLYYSNTATGLYSVSSNTPLVLYGKGTIDYGAIIQNNLLYLLENFSSATRPKPPVKGMLWYKSTNVADIDAPTDPATSGLYLWNGTNWDTVLVNNRISSTIQVNNQRITNVGNATSATDALNVQYADTRYLLLTGGTISGNITIGSTYNISSSNDPTQPGHLINKLYFDTNNTNLQNLIESNRITAETSINLINTNLVGYLQKAGGIMTGVLTCNANVTLSGSSSLLLSNGIGTMDVGNRRIQSVAAPSDLTDATNKGYVDSAITNAISSLPPSGGGSDGVVYQGSFNNLTNVITLNRTQSLSDVVISGEIAAKLHSHNSDAVSYDITTNAGPSILPIKLAEIGVTATQVSATSILKLLDQVAYFSTIDPIRHITAQTGTDTTFMLPAKCEYEVWSDRLHVTVDGIKKYADVRARTDIHFTNVVTPPGLLSVVPLVAGVHYFYVTVDGGTPALVNILHATGDTYFTLISNLADAISTALIPVSTLVESSYDGLWVSLVSHVSGATHSVALSYDPGELFSNITDSTIPNSILGETHDYEEIGIPGELSNQVLFHVAPTVSSKLEFLIAR